jgi:putative ABC transport system permease protein
MRLLFVSLRDLQWRRRRFIIGVLATGLVFALALVLSGVDGSFRNEIDRTVEAFSVDRWVVSDTAYGPFTSSALFPASRAEELANQPSVDAVEPIVVLRFTVPVPDPADLTVVGVERDGMVAPPLSDGRQIESSGEIIVDKLLGVGLDDDIDVGGESFRVVGRTSGISFYAGTPVGFVAIDDAQQLALGGAELATAFVVRGDVDETPPDLRVMTNDGVVDDLRRPMEKATGTISFINVLLWIVAAGIIGSLLYLQALERTRDFAVFKATGVTSRSLVVGLAFQAIVLAVFSAIAAVLLSLVIGPLLPMSVEVPASAYVVLPVVAVIVGLLASLGGLRRAVGVDPALAFGGA